MNDPLARVHITIDAPGDDKYLLEENLNEIKLTLMNRRRSQKIVGPIYDEDGSRVGKWVAEWTDGAR